MILSMASRLTDRQTVWVSRKNNDESFNRISTDYGVSAVTIASHWAEVHAGDVKNFE